MVDIRLVQNLQFPNLSVPLDWNLLPNGTLDTTHDIETAILVALGTDALAGPDDVLPDPDSADHRGWWGDLDAKEIWGGWPIGWKGWLLTRSKITDANAKGGSTVSIVQDYLHAALMPFVQNRILTNFTLAVERNAQNRQEIDAFVTAYRGINQLQLRFAVFTNVSSAIALPPSIDGPVYVITL
jgi:phage gp46-like protein